MFVSTIVPAVLALAGRGLALPARDVPMTVFESIETPQEGWAEHSQPFVKRESAIQLRIQLADQNMDVFEQKALNVCQTSNSLP